MKKRILSIILASVMVMSMTVLLSGCGSVDPVGLVKANLDYVTSGEITDEILENTDQTEEELAKVYEDDMKTAVDEFVSQMDCEAYATDEKRAVVEDFIKKAMKKAKYEVDEEYTEKDGVYSVKVKIYPMDFMQTAEEYMNGELVTKWENAVANGTYTYTTDEQLMVDIYDDLFEYLSGVVESTGYLDAVECTIAVEEDEDGVYMPKESDLEKAGSLLMSL